MPRDAESADKHEPHPNISNLLTPVVTTALLSDGRTNVCRQCQFMKSADRQIHSDVSTLGRQRRVVLFSREGRIFPYSTDLSMRLGHDPNNVGQMGKGVPAIRG